MTHKWNDNHGEDKLYSNTGKFEVYRRKSEQDLVEKLGEDGEFIFVLRPERDEAAHIAMRVYAAAVYGRSPQLALDIQEQLDRIEVEQHAILYGEVNGHE